MIHPRSKPMLISGMDQIHGQCTYVQVLSILPSPSTHLKNRGKYKYFVKNSSTKYLENFSRVQSSTSNNKFIFHNGEGQCDENKSSSIMHLFKGQLGVLQIWTVDMV